MTWTAWLWCGCGLGLDQGAGNSPRNLDGMGRTKTGVATFSSPRWQWQPGVRKGVRRRAKETSKSQTTRWEGGEVQALAGGDSAGDLGEMASGAEEHEGGHDGNLSKS